MTTIDDSNSSRITTFSDSATTTTGGGGQPKLYLHLLESGSGSFSNKSEVLLDYCQLESKWVSMSCLGEGGSF